MWFDGTSTVSEKELISRLIRGESIRGLFVDAVSTAIEQYNRNVKNQVTVKTDIEPIGVSWQLPESYAKLGVREHVMNLTYEYCLKKKWIVETGDDVVTTREAKDVIKRVNKELALFKKYEYFSLLRVLIFIINTLHTNNVVWGVGRGSSVSSFVLYLIGVHDVDSIKYDLDIEDFLHD